MFIGYLSFHRKKNWRLFLFIPNNLTYIYIYIYNVISCYIKEIVKRDKAIKKRNRKQERKKKKESEKKKEIKNMTQNGGKMTR